jgi:hypothetical protein
MQKEVKKEVWRVGKVAIFLLVSIVVVLPYLVQVSTYFHEEAHVKVLDKYKIRNYHGVDLLRTIPNFFNPEVKRLGVTKFDYGQYRKLDRYKKAELHIAGVVSDLKFLFLIGIYLSFVNMYLFYKIRFKKEINFIWLLAINWILFMWLLALIQITVANVTYSSGDFYQLVKILSG